MRIRDDVNGPMELYMTLAVDLARMIRSRELSAAELLAAVLARIETSCQIQLLGALQRSDVSASIREQNDNLNVSNGVPSRRFSRFERQFHISNHDVQVAVHR